MKTLTPINADNFGDILLYGAVMLAGIDYTGILDYAIKAAIGGATWFLFKVAGDYFAARFKKGTGSSPLDIKSSSDIEDDEGGLP